MAQTHRSPVPNEADERLTGWVGWILFAAVIMFTAGFINVIEGLVALFKDGYYLVRPSGLVVQMNYTAWGWTLLLFGAVLVLTGFGVATGRMWARVAGIVLACLNAVVNLSFISAYPIWITLVIT